MDKISIIVPMYNAQKHLERSLGSIVNQTFKNFEVIIVDDGSTDNSLAIANEFAKKDERFKVFTKSNGGVSTARNYALTKATGNLIKFQDADDDMAPTALQRLYDLLKQNDVDMVTCRFTHPCLKQLLKPGKYDLTQIPDLIAFNQDFGAMTMPWNKLFKREAITEKFDEELHFAEDELFNFANIKNIKSVYVTDEILYNYYVAPPDPNEPPSALIKLMQGEFWETESTQWFLARNILPKRQEVAKSFPAELQDDLAYNRVFDFFFWEYIMLLGMVPHKEGIIAEVTRILKQDVYKKTISLKEKFGVKFIYDSSLEEKARKYVESCLLVMSQYQGFEFYDIVTELFCKIFCVKCGELKTYDTLARAMNALIEDKDELAHIINCLK